MGTDNTLYALMPGYVHITHDPVTNRNYINVVDRNPLEVGMPKEHTEEFTSKLAGGWRNDEIFTRDADGNRVCTLVNLKALPPVESWDLSAVDFDPMAAHLKATGLDVKLAKQ